MPESKGRMIKVLRGMRRMLDVPVTVKFRTGLKHGILTNHKLVPVFEDLVCCINGLYRFFSARC